MQKSTSNTNAQASMTQCMTLNLSDMNAFPQPLAHLLGEVGDRLLPIPSGTTADDTGNDNTYISPTISLDQD